MKDPTKLLNALLSKFNKESPIDNIDFNQAGGMVISLLTPALSTAATASAATSLAATASTEATALAAATPSLTRDTKVQDIILYKPNYFAFHKDRIMRRSRDIEQIQLSQGVGPIVNAIRCHSSVLLFCGDAFFHIFSAVYQSKHCRSVVHVCRWRKDSNSNSNQCDQDDSIEYQV